MKKVSLATLILIGTLASGLLYAADAVKQPDAKSAQTSIQDEKIEKPNTPEQKKQNNSDDNELVHPFHHEGNLENR